MKYFLNLGFQRQPKAVGCRLKLRHRNVKKQLRRKMMKRLNASMKRLKAETNEIQKEQEIVKMGQKEVREKFEAIQFECEKLRKETQRIKKQSLNTQLRLAVMFQILKARESNDFSKAATLTQLLRELIARQNN